MSGHMEQTVMSVRNAVLTEVNRNKETIFNGMLDGAPVYTLPESVFVQYFLPRFTGQLQSANWIVEWISISGSPMAEVSIYDDNTKQELYRVPPLFYTNNLISQNKSVKLTDIFNRFEQINNNIPQAATNFLFTALGEKQKELWSNQNHETVKAAWGRILSRYNLIPTNTLTGSSLTNNSSDGSVDDYFDM